jgi:hypothetical protein
VPPAVEPVHEQVIAAVLGILQGIVAGGTYWHTTEKAVADPYFHQGHMDASLTGAKASYVVSHDQDEDESDSFADYGVRIELDITAFRKFEPAAEGEPYRPQTAPKRHTIQARLAADVKNALRADEHLAAVTGLQAKQVWVPFTHFAADETLFTGWAVAMLRVVIVGSHGQVAA